MTNKKEIVKDVILSDTAIDVVNFSKKYHGNKNYAVKNVSFKVMKGEFHGFIGANGAGKTTTIKSLIGAYAKFGGNITIFGDKHTSIKAKKRMGYIPETTNFPKTLNTLQYITHMTHLSGIPWKEAKKFALNAIEDIGLTKVMRRKPSTFSSGQKKKVLLAQALANNPDVIIMDEPAANLDPKARNDFFNTLKKLQKKGMAIFISSHILSELDQYVDSITIIDGGKIVYSGARKELINDDDNSFVIVPDDQKDNIKIQNIAKSLKLKSKFIESDNGMMIMLKNKEQQWLLMECILEKKIIIKKFNLYTKTLQEVYNHYVNLGSVDTMNKNIKNQRGPR